MWQRCKSFLVELHATISDPTHVEEVVGGVLLVCLGIDLMTGHLVFPFPEVPPAGVSIPNPLRFLWLTHLMQLPILRLAPHFLGVYTCVLGYRLIWTAWQGVQEDLEEEPEAE